VTRVLVVEDEESFSDALSYMLRREGYEVSVAANGIEGLASYDRTGADLVLLDLMLPGMSGTEVCRALRQKSNVPIIILTARDSEVDKVVGLELGADDYVTKPFSIVEVIARLRVALRRRRRAKQGGGGELGARFGVVELDIAGRRIMVENVEVDSTAREFDLLLFLHTHPGTVFSREQLMQQVWGPNHFGTVRTVDNFIARLRAKIEDDPDDPKHIETVRGVGYRFNP
jgi:two-component system, OmpR family, response regulator RegX3